MDGREIIRSGIDYCTFITIYSLHYKQSTVELTEWTGQDEQTTLGNRDEKGEREKERHDVVFYKMFKR